MTDPAAESRFDADAFLTWEAQQPEKHEYVGGDVFAMVGARREHVVVSGNVFAAFKERLRGGPCQAYVSDLKLRVAAADAFFYPDVMVSCDQSDQSATLFIRQPILIVEVLSESTEAFDRGDKFAAYRSLDSLQEYVLVDIQARRVEVFRRTPEQDWLFHEYLPGCGDCVFPALGVSIPFDAVFENVKPAEEAAGLDDGETAGG